MSNKILFVVILMLLSTTLLFSQTTVNLEPYGVSPTQVKADTVGDPNYIGILDRVYSGLLNVGVETQMVLKGSSDTTLISPTWNVASVPGGSAVTDVASVTVVDTATEVALFTPDVIGTYVVEFTSDGVTASVTINAGTYLGVGDEGGCANAGCHSDKVADWLETGHSSMFDRGLNGTLGSYWEESCISCHTTGYDTLATNDGFDDFGFVFPDSLGLGILDSMWQEYPDAMRRANIQCESCHGPGSDHNGNIADSKMVSSFDVAACAQCHDDDHYHVYPSQWEASGHAEGNTLSRGTRAGCAQCHSGSGFVAWIKNGKEELAEAPPVALIGCAACHDPHDATNEYHLRTVEAVELPSGDIVDGGLGNLCMNCHNSRRDALERAAGTRPAPHDGPQAEMLFGVNAPTYGKTLPSSPHMRNEDACVSCHMYENGSHGEHDADGNLNTSGMHSFSMVNKDGVDNVAACASCHGDVGATFAEKKFYMNGTADHDGDGTEEGLQVEVEGLMHDLSLMLDPVDSTDVTTSDSDGLFTLSEKYAIYNYELVYWDRSHGIHNPAFTVSLLKLSMQAIENNQQEGSIVGIEDIPNDQGKAVRILWNSFVDDGVAADPIETYVVKRDDGDDTWTTVAELTASGSNRYAVVVPTLYDSTSAGSALTSFVVAAVSKGGVTYESDAAEGYSIDNLVPMAPQNLASMVASGDVTLSWDEAVDPDVKYYRVFRSAESGFVAGEANEIGTSASLEYVDLDIAGTVYYKVIAVDFSGNNSDASDQIEVVATAMGEEGIPTEFGLSQNYPNPFNPSTHIQVSLKDAGHVTLEVYNALGQKINALLNRDMTAGVHSVTFDGTGLSSGVYFYKVIVTGVNGSNVAFQDMHKMILMK